MAVFYAPETAMAKELRKWEYGNPADGFRGYREVVCTEFPKVLNLAGDTDEGIRIVDKVIAEHAEMQRNLESRGFRVSAVEAIKVAQGVATEVAKLAAERHYHERHMSDAAQREVAAAEGETDRHLPVIPETPIKRRGRKPKAAAVAAQE